jgi:hypothetical protein
MNEQPDQRAAELDDTEHQQHEMVPVGLSSDTIIAIADQAERRIEAVKKIKTLALRVTNHQDWVDMGGKPYLQASGGEKVARLFGICWQVDEPTFLTEEDGHFMYGYVGKFSLGTATIEAVGTRSSRDAFFSTAKGADIPPTEIDRGDVKKAAYTNCIANGVTRILGIRNLTWEELKAAGIDQAKTGRVGFDEKGITLPNFGEYASQPLKDVPTTALTSYRDNLAKSTNEKWKARNAKLVEAIDAEVARRTSEQPAPQAESPSPSPMDRAADLGILYQDHRNMVEKATTVAAMSAATNAALDDTRLTPEQKSAIRILRDQRMADLNPTKGRK